MLKLGPRHFLAETAEDLPAPRKGRIFLDAETRSRHDDLRSGGDSPYLGDRACMWAIAFDDDGPAVAIPYRMRSSPNLPVETVSRWLSDILRISSVWTNHNVKFDAHFALQDGATFDGIFEDTLTLAKIYHSDRFSYSLKPLAHDWLGIAPSTLDKVEAYLDGYKLPKRAKAKDYSIIPSVILGEYACDDVLTNRDLFRWITAKMDAELTPTWEMEKRLTPCLFDMEVAGLRVDRQQIKVEKMLSLHKQIRLATLVTQKTGLEFADSNKFAYELFIAQWGLPVLAKNKENGNPSFDKDALLAYRSHPEIAIDPERVEVVEAVIQLRKENTFCGLFADVLEEEADANGFVHPDYNQIVRTGRMSCRKPNAQQFDSRAKKLIHSDGPEFIFSDYDASQVEFRIIVHYINDEDAIKAYEADPKTDFHTWVANLCQIPRKPAKNFNFAQAFGAGMKKLVAMLAAQPMVIDAVSAQIEGCDPSERMELFRKLCWERGKEIYDTYHERLPGIKRMSKKAGAIAASRGFVKNLFGRRRHLPVKAAHNAFNTVVQGSAMDLIKRRIIATAPRYNPELRAAGISQRANVHDSLLFHGTPEALREFHPWIMEQLQYREEFLRVPILWDHAYTTTQWKE